MRWAIAAASVAFGMCVASGAWAQTWVAPRSNPSLSELVAIDETGEALWPYGSEDVLGDGGEFTQAEQEIDLRSAYATTDANRFYVRAYVSSADAVSDDVTVYVFIDTDENANTGGPADDPAIDPDLSADPSPGGYEYVIGIQGNGMLSEVWSWDGNAFDVETVPQPQVDVEAGADEDPIFVLLNQHGYLQATIDLGVVGLTATCDANLLFRSVNAGGDGDGNLGAVGACVPSDSNNDNVPDIAATDSCTDDDQCPGIAVCVDGQCVTATPCLDDDDCAADEACSADGACRVVGGGACMSDDECDRLVCDNGMCAGCDLGGNQCGDGRSCGPDGRCVDGTTTGGGGSGGGLLGPGDQVQGGACSCTLPGRSFGGAPLGWAAAFVAALALGLRRRERTR